MTMSTTRCVDFGVYVDTACAQNMRMRARPTFDFGADAKHAQLNTKPVEGEQPPSHGNINKHSRAELSRHHIQLCVVYNYTHICVNISPSYCIVFAYDKHRAKRPQDLRQKPSPPQGGTSFARGLKGCILCSFRNIWHDSR